MKWDVNFLFNKMLLGLTDFVYILVSDACIGLGLNRMKSEGDPHSDRASSLFSPECRRLISFCFASKCY